MEKGIKVLAADDDPQMQLAIKASLSRAGYEVTIVSNGRDALTHLEQDTFDVIITDQRMPEMSGAELLAAVQKREIATPVILITAYGTITQAVEAMQLGAADFITKPFSAEELERVVERVTSAETRMFRSQKSKRTRKGKPIITNDPLMIRMLEVAEAVARSDATVLIQGESGTGKELIARLIHSASPRAQSAFVAVNCAALPENLLESELFGHEKGSFTGAMARKIGKFELAHGGTILLDEVSEMELGLQAKLLRVLQEREVDRVGGQSPIAVDVRVLATTNRNLEEYVGQGKFRADLFYRLNVIPLTLPALRDRRSDIKLLVEHFMRQYLGADAPQLEAQVLAALQNHPWPGNVRELQNAVERAAILARGGAVREADFLLTQNGSVMRNQVVPIQPAVGLAANIERETTIIESSDEATGLQIRSGMTVQEMERTLIIETLRSTNDNRTQAAKLLGISIRTLRNKLHEYRMANGEDAGDSASDVGEGVDGAELGE